MEKIAELGRPQITKWPMRTEFWILKAKKHSLRIPNTYCFSTETMDAQTSQCYVVCTLPVLLIRYLHCSSFYF